MEWTQLLFSLKSGIILKSPQIRFCPWEMDEKQAGNVVTSRRVVSFNNLYTKSFCQFPLKLNSIPKGSLWSAVLRISCHVRCGLWRSSDSSLAFGNFVMWSEPMNPSSVDFIVYVHRWLWAAQSISKRQTLISLSEFILAERTVSLHRPCQPLAQSISLFKGWSLRKNRNRSAEANAAIFLQENPGETISLLALHSVLRFQIELCKLSLKKRMIEWLAVELTSQNDPSSDNGYKQKGSCSVAI